MTEIAQTNGNGSSKKSALVLLLASLEGQKAPNASDIKAVSEKFKKAAGKRAEIEAQLKKFDEEFQKTAVDMVKCFGNKHVTVDGVRYVPTSRGDRVYYKRMSDELETVEL